MISSNKFSHLSSEQRKGLLFSGQTGSDQVISSFDPVGTRGSGCAHGVIVEEFTGLVADVLDRHEFLMEDYLLVHMRSFYAH